MENDNCVNYGYGFYLYNGKNDMAVIEFFEKHKETYSKLLPKDKVDEKYRALAELKKSFANGGKDTFKLFFSVFEGNLPSELAKIIRSEIKLNIYAVGSKTEEGNKQCIVYLPAYPWDMSDDERSMTLKDIHYVLMKYSKELNIDEKDIGFKVISYFD